MNREEAIERMKTMRWEHATNPCPDRDAFDMAISALSENKTFKGMTNGEVLKLIFPDAELLSGDSDYIPNVFSVKEEWWNAPYKTESEVSE